MVIGCYPRQISTIFVRHMTCIMIRFVKRLPYRKADLSNALRCFKEELCREKVYRISTLSLCFNVSGTFCRKVVRSADNFSTGIFLDKSINILSRNRPFSRNSPFTRTRYNSKKSQRKLFKARVVQIKQE